MSASAANVSWTREMDAVWCTGENWTGGLPVTTEMSVFYAGSAFNMNTTGAAEVSVQDLKITTPEGLISIGGMNTLTLGAGGFSVSNDTLGLAMEAVVAIAVEQARNEASMQKLAVKGGADVSLSKIGMGDLTLGGANSFAAAVVEDRSLSVSERMSGVKVEKLAFTNFGTTQIGAAPRVAGPRVGELRFGSGVERGGVRTASNRGKGVVKITVRGGVKAGANTKQATSDAASEDLRAALALPDGVGPLLAQNGGEGLPLGDTGSINTDASNVILDDVKIVPVIHQGASRQYTTVKLVPLVSPPTIPDTYGINFDGTYRGPAYPILGTLGPGAANQANWNNIHSGSSVNDGNGGNFDATITDRNLANPLTLHVTFGNADGGNDGGPPNPNDDFNRLYSTGLRLGDVWCRARTDVAPYSLYDVFIYNVGKNFNVNGIGIAGPTGPRGNSFVLGQNYVQVLGLTGPLDLYAYDSINGFSILPVTPPTVAYWKGTTSGVWNASLNNFTKEIAGTNAIRAAISGITDVIFNANGATNFANTTLGVDTTIKSLSFGSNATASVGIGGSNTLTITPDSTLNGVTVASLSGNHTLSTMVALGAAQTWTVTDVAQTLNANGVISGAFSLTKTGAGTLVFTADNTYSGGTTVALGTLALDYTVVGSKLADAGVLTFAGGTVDLKNGAGSHNEVVAATTISDGLSNVTRSSGTSVLRLNAITPGLGVLNFGASSIADTDRTNTNGILGAWATVAGADWATNSTDVADGPITAYSAYTDIAVRGVSTIADSPTTNVRLNGDGTSGDIALGAVTTTISTLLQNNANFAGTVDTSGKALVTSGIMIGSGKESLTIGAAVGDGTLNTTTAGGTLFLNNFSASKTLTVNAVIADNTSASSLATVGRVVLNGANTYSGATMVNSGALNIQNNTALGGTAGGTTVHLGGALELQSATGITIGTETLTVNGTGISNGGVLRSISGNNTWGGTITLASGGRINSDAGTLTLSAANSITATNQNLALGGAGNGVVSGTITTGIGTLTKDGTGMWTLSGTNTYSGATQVDAGTLLFKNTAARPAGSTVTVAAAGTIGLGVGGAGFYSVTDVDNLFDSTLSGFTMNAASGVAIDTTAGDFNQTTALTTATRALTKLGANKLTLSGLNSYAGPTSVNEGTLLITGAITSNTTVSNAALTVLGTITGTATANSGGTITVSGTISGSTTVNSGGTLGGQDGTVGNVTINNGGTLSPGVSGTGELNTGTVTFNSGSIYQFQIDTTSIAIDRILITGNLNIMSGAMMVASDLGSEILPQNGVVPIMTYTGSWNGGGFMGLADEAIFTVGLNAYQISYNGSDGLTKEVTLTVVPEPGAAVSLLGGLGLLLGVRRRRA